MKFFSVCHFKNYQHYQNRNIFWIKLHLQLLDDFDFYQFDDWEKYLFIGLLMLAGRLENKIPYSEDYIRNKLLIRTLKPIFSVLSKFEAIKFIKITDDSIDTSIDKSIAQNRIEENREEENRKNIPAPQADAEAQNLKAEKAEWLIKFENWWGIYPSRKGVKCGKQAAKEAFLRVITTLEAYNNLIAATNAYKGSRQLQELDCAKDAERFLKKDYWKDWIPKPAPARAAEPKVLSPREEAEKKEPNFCDKCNHRGLLFREPGEKDWHAADCENKDFLRYIQKYSENKRCECNPE